MDEKVTAEELFRGKKASYESSIPHMFRENRLSKQLLKNVFYYGICFVIIFFAGYKWKKTLTMDL